VVVVRVYSVWVGRRCNVAGDAEFVNGGGSDDCYVLRRQNGAGPDAAAATPRAVQS
jgi:hypothetical protein